MEAKNDQPVDKKGSVFRKTYQPKHFPVRSGAVFAQTLLQVWAVDSWEKAADWYDERFEPVQRPKPEKFADRCMELSSTYLTKLASIHADAYLCAYWVIRLNQRRWLIEGRFDKSTFKESLRTAVEKAKELVRGEKRKQPQQAQTQEQRQQQRQHQRPQGRPGNNPGGPRSERACFAWNDNPRDCRDPCRRGFGHFCSVGGRDMHHAARDRGCSRAGGCRGN